jgi:coenzyme A diphosphatase NUDT7
VRAAVLVLLYERAGQGGLRVLLTTRSKELRSHPGQTALPGGKVDQSDAGVIDTAVRTLFLPLRAGGWCVDCGGFLVLFVLCWPAGRQFREANEEVGLPLRSPHVHTLCTLEPFVSQYRVLVTPVIAFLDDVGVLDGLCAAPGEVARIFDHPLEALLDPELAHGRETTLVPLGSDDWPYETEVHVSFVHSVTSLVFVCLTVRCFFEWKKQTNKQNFTDVPWLGRMYRMHRFRSTASPVKGLTADILVCNPLFSLFPLDYPNICLFG